MTGMFLSLQQMNSPEGRLEWIPDEKILDLNLWESDHIFMSWIREGKFFSAKFEEGDTMRRYNVVSILDKHIVI
jgi:8-oxo-dGTP diphosphatase